LDSQYEIYVSGRVQGVGFRAAAKKQARWLHLKGWVENQNDGSVKIVIRGESRNCTHFINWCREGTAYSWVDKVKITEMKPEDLGPFRVIY
jgi:acylphosphatase